MRVRALVPFAARINAETLAVQAGDIVDLPAGADWLSAGLVAPVPDDVVETTELPMVEVERAVTRKRKST